MRKTIARRLTESKQQIPHIYLTVDIQIDALLKLRGELNESLKSRGVKLSVNDMLIKALAISLIEVPACNVSFAGDQLLKYSRADVSVRSEEHTSELQSLIRISYAVLCLKKNNYHTKNTDLSSTTTYH